MWTCWAAALWPSTTAIFTTFGGAGGAAAQGARQLGAQIGSSGLETAGDVRVAGVAFARTGSTAVDYVSTVGSTAASAAQDAQDRPNAPNEDR